jgi:eukaryotic-like serine/threonine-protein kinase
MSEPPNENAGQPSPGSDTDRLGAILETFLARYRQGERPSVPEFVNRHPELAEEVRELLPALVEMEQLGSHAGEADSACQASSRADAVERAPLHGSRRLPERLGDYRILRKIGSGGMGVVYEAVRESLHSHVALKVMHARFRGDQTYVRRFHTEASSAARLHHTNVVSVFDYGKHDGVYYYAMQYIAGHGVDRILDDVRRLRGGERDRASPASADVVRLPWMTQSEAQHGGERDPESDRVIESSPRPVALGLLDGRCGADPVVGVTNAATPDDPATTGEVDSQPVDAIESTRSGRFELLSNPADDGWQSPARALEETSLPGTGPSSGSSSLTGKTEDRYFREVARLVAQAADALAYSHERGVLHRDIKPSNLLIDATGTLWVTDFGLAKFEGDEDLSRSQDLVGTLRYMAPERFRRSSDRRSDIYALGATLYEMLTLQPVFEGRDQLHLIDRIKNEPPTPPRHHDRRIPRDLETIVLKALAKDPGDRFATADKLAAELRRFHENRPIQSRPVPWNERLWRWGRRNPMIASLNVLAACLTIAIAVISTEAAYRSSRLASQLQTKNDAAAYNLRQANHNLVLAYAAQAEAHQRSRRPGQRFPALDAIERAVQLASVGGMTETERYRLRNTAIGAMSLPDFRVVKELELRRGKENGFAIDQACERYATKLENGGVVVRRVSDGSELLRLAGLPPSKDHTLAQFSPNGRYLATSAGNRDVVEVWDLERGRRLCKDDDAAPSNVNNWSFHPDSAEIAVADKDGSVAIYALPSGDLVKPWAEPVVANCIVAYSPDGSKLAVRDRESKTVKVIARDSGRVYPELPQPAVVNHFVWDPRSPQILAVACENGTICLWNVDSRQQTGVLRGENSDGMVIAFHPSGDVLASRGWQNVLRLWDARGGQKLLEQPSAWHSTLEFIGSGNRLSGDLTGDAARILEVALPTECRALASEPLQNRSFGPIAIDRAGARLVSSGDRVTIWDLPAGVARATIDVNRGSHRVLFDDSGAILTQRPEALRWPIAEKSDGTVSIGPPQLLHRRGFSDEFVISADGKTILQSGFGFGGLVFDSRHPWRHRWLRPHPDVRSIAMSPDGRWIVTGSHALNDGMKLWEAATGRFVHDFPGVPRTMGGSLRFSPDGKWLAVAGDGWTLIDASTWKPAKRLYRGPTNWLVFSADSRTAIFDDNAGMMTLVDLASARPLAQLEDPEQARHDMLALTPNGSQLVTSIRGKPYLRIWDLALIRRQLSRLGLDWTSGPQLDLASSKVAWEQCEAPYRVERGKLDQLVQKALVHHQRGGSWPTGEPAVARYTADLTENPNDLEARKLRGLALAGLGRYREAVEDFTIALSDSAGDIDLLSAAGRALAQLGRHREAIANFNAALQQTPEDSSLLAARSRCHEVLGDHGRAADDLTRAVRLDPAHAKAANDLAWDLVTGPVASRDQNRGFVLAEAAAAADPANSAMINTLGVAHYRAGNYSAAIKMLTGHEKGARGTTGFDEVFLAMAYHNVGRPNDARRMLIASRRSLAALTTTNPNDAADLRELLAEAEALILDSAFPASPFVREQP